LLVEYAASVSSCLASTGGLSGCPDVSYVETKAVPDNRFRVAVEYRHKPLASSSGVPDRSLACLSIRVHFSTQPDLPGPEEALLSQAAECAQHAVRGAWPRWSGPGDCRARLARSECGRVQGAGGSGTSG